MVGGRKSAKEWRSTLRTGIAGARRGYAYAKKKFPWQVRVSRKKGRRRKAREYF